MGDALALDREVDRRRHVTHVEGSLVRPELGDGVIDEPEVLGDARQGLRLRDALGHRGLVLEPLVDVLERRDHREDRQAFLVGLSAPGGERPAVVDAVDRERDRLVHLAGTQEVAVHRVHEPIGGDRALRGHEGLREHLSAEDPAVRHPLTGTGEDVLARAGAGVGEVEGPEEAAEGVAHAL